MLTSLITALLLCLIHIKKPNSGFNPNVWKYILNLQTFMLLCAHKHTDTYAYFALVPPDLNAQAMSHMITLTSKGHFDLEM